MSAPIHRREVRQRRRARTRVAHLPQCPITGKVRFRDKTEAVECLHKAATARWFGSQRRRECRSYRCTHCSGWHVTSLATYQERPAG